MLILNSIYRKLHWCGSYREKSGWQFGDKLTLVTFILMLTA